MRTLTMTALAAAGLALVAAPTAGQEENPEAVSEATAVAEGWLGLIDDGQFQESWEAAGAAFRESLTAESWEQQARMVVGQTGAVESRELAESQYTTNLPGAPAGEYVLLRYTSAYANLEDAVEVIALMEEGESWKVVGWQVRPGG